MNFGLGDPPAPEKANVRMHVTNAHRLCLNREDAVKGEMMQDQKYEVHILRNAIEFFFPASALWNLEVYR